METQMDKYLKTLNELIEKCGKDGALMVDVIHKDKTMVHLYMYNGNGRWMSQDKPVNGDERIYYINKRFGDSVVKFTDYSLLSLKKDYEFGLGLCEHLEGLIAELNNS